MPNFTNMKSEKDKLAAKTVEQLKAAAKRLGGKLITPDGKAKTKQQLINTIVMKNRLAGKSMGGVTTTKKATVKKTMAKKPANKTMGGSQKEYFVYLDGSLIDKKGFKTRYGVTADTKREAQRLLSKAKLYYAGTYQIEPKRYRITQK